MFLQKLLNRKLTQIDIVNMTIYALFFATLLIGALVNPRKPSNGFLLFVIIFLYLIIGLRSANVGVDTIDYVGDFKAFSRYNLSQLVNIMRERHEPLYVLISWLPSILSDHYSVYLLVWAIFPAIALYRVFKGELNNNSDYLFAFLVFFILGLFEFFIAGIRQTASLSIILFNYPIFKDLKFDGLRSLNNKNWLIFILSMLLAYLIHNSSLIFIFAFVAKMFKPRWWYIFIAFGAYFLGSFVNMDQLSMLSAMIFEERFGHYENQDVTLSMSGFYIQLMIFAMCLYQRNSLIKSNSENSFLMNMMLIGLVIQSLAGVFAEMFRVSFFFSMFTMIFLPRAIKEYEKYSWGKFLKVGFVVMALLYIFQFASRHIPEYSTSLG